MNKLQFVDIEREKKRKNILVIVRTDCLINMEKQDR